MRAERDDEGARPVGELARPAAFVPETKRVAELLRTGYLWNTRVLRPAMVKVRG